MQYAYCASDAVTGASFNLVLVTERVRAESQTSCTSCKKDWLLIQQSTMGNYESLCAVPWVKTKMTKWKRFKVHYILETLLSHSEARVL